MHSPGSDTPIEQTVDAMQLVYASGRYKHVGYAAVPESGQLRSLRVPQFGLSNLKPEDVKRVYDYAASKKYVLPTVFQGSYNPVARHQETTLFPLLRELNIAFYANSPLADGFLVKDAQTFNTGGGQGRWDPNHPVGKVYNEIYIKPSLLEALSEWEATANEARVSKAALAYRWMMYNSKLSAEHGDGIVVRIFGAHISHSESIWSLKTSLQSRHAETSSEA